MSDRCSIVIPVRDRAGLTRRCLDALLADPPRAAFELVVVDDGSTDTTAELLAGYGEALTVVRHAENLGFAAACNDGAAASGGEYLVFLNNDTIPQPGWLDALHGYAERQPEAAVVGSKLLYPNDTVQHAGVVFCPEGKARHVYQGFPADHPAVNKSRPFQAVTFACALVRRSAFDRAGGFETAFENDLEDVDLCLRLGQLGFEVHYCHESVLYHLESVSRGRQLPQQSARLYRERWSSRVRADDLSYYLEDELLQVRYKEPYPIRMKISPELASTNGWAGTEETERLLHTLSRQVLDLLEETARLTSHVADLELGGEHGAVPRPPREESAAAPLSHEQLHRRTREIELQIHGLQSALASAAGSDRFAPGRYLDYRNQLARVHELVASSVPAGSVVLVVSRGDDELLELDARQGWHFPRDEGGSHPGYNPPDSGSVIAHLEELRARGAEYLLIPRTELWWLDHYADFANHLETRYSVLARDDESCLIFAIK